MSTLICIDNGGTLTDAIAVRDGKFYRAKALTTPHDLSKCFIDSINALSREIYGSEALGQLLAETEIIRYSTTQGTNALVQARDKGPRLGLLVPAGTAASALLTSPEEHELFATLVGERINTVDESLDDAEYRKALIQSVNTLLTKGTNRIVLALDGEAYAERESRFRRVFLQCFPRHFLGAIPLLLSHQLANDGLYRRRAWSSLFNSFLHPTMEHFLYNAENELRKHGMQRPLMVFRNDGNSSRVAKTVAMKTYSSGPRGGMEGARVYAEAYGAKRIISFDVGGTTTDIGVASADGIDEMQWGKVEGVETAFPLCDILSAGIGGSSVLGFANGSYKVGPESVGAAPGPACFARGGERPTITDVYLLAGYFDPATYFGGKLRIDAAMAEKAVTKHVAEPAGVALSHALLALDGAYHEVMTAAITGHAKVDEHTLLMAFGGAGPMSACNVAELAGVNTVIVPHAASVFCAYGIGFSDVHYKFEEAAGADGAAVLANLMGRARRDMFAEGFDADACEVICKLISEEGAREVHLDPSGGNFPEVPPDARVRVDIVRRLERFPVRALNVGDVHAAQSSQTRRCLQSDGSWQQVALYALDALQAGAQGNGPAVLEDAYTTVRVLAGWQFRITGNLDLMLTRTAQRPASK